MDNTRIIVREYLESLKEDGELDYLFPILLDLMGFQIVTTPRVAKGSKQYGKDVVAIGNNTEGIRCRYYFELKGESDKDITTHSFNKPDGIRESIQESLDKPYQDTGIPGFNDLPAVIIVVHNGLLKQEVTEQFEGFLKRNFPNGGFERWDINRLAELFYQHLFSEYLLTDSVNVRLLKRVLMFITEPDYNFSDLRNLLIRMDAEVNGLQKKRALTKYFASMRLIAVLITHYSEEVNNLHAGREGLTILVLHLWRWVLTNRLVNKRPIIRQFRELLRLQYNVLDTYFQNTLPTALLPDGLFAEQGQFFEEIGYPLRSYEYLSYYVYYCELQQYLYEGEPVPSGAEHPLSVEQKRTLFQLIEQNPGCTRPLLDSHLIPIVQVILFALEQGPLTVTELNALQQYVFDNLQQLHLIRLTRHRWPLMSNDLSVLAEYVSTNQRPARYQDVSSLLIPVLFEFLVVLRSKNAYSTAVEMFKLYELPNLQMAHPIRENSSLEVDFFSGHLHEEYDTESNIDLPDDFQELTTHLATIPISNSPFQTDQVGLSFLRRLAQLHFRNEPFPEEWRLYCQEANSISVVEAS